MSGLVAHELRIADPDRRCYAFLLDRVLAGGIVVALASTAGRSLWTRGHPWSATAVVLATGTAVELLLAVLLGRTGATPGKALLGIRVVHTGSGTPIGVDRAVQRGFVVALAALPFGMGLTALARSALADPSGLRRGWHDHLVSSVSVDGRAGPATV